jgi:hypothetical protein
VVEGGQPLEGGSGTGPAGGGNRGGEGSKSSQSSSVKEKSRRSSSKRSPAKTSSSEPASTETTYIEAGPEAASDRLKNARTHSTSQRREGRRRKCFDSQNNGSIGSRVMQGGFPTCCSSYSLPLVLCHLKWSRSGEKKRGNREFEKTKEAEDGET